MPLEATMLVLDNSEWMRNGDYTPTRLEAQSDAVNLIFSSKTQSNPENTVGLLTMAGKGPEVLVTLTSDMGKILTAMHNIKIGGAVNLTTGIQVAQLALKHRQNKNQRQRIIVFVGSPIDSDEKNLVKLAKKMKKNNVAVDIVNFGEETNNTTKLEAFLANVNASDNRHASCPHILSELLISSPIISGEDGLPAGFTPGGGGSFEFGVDPNLDPELALALRISLEEEKARQEAEAAKAATSAVEGESTTMAVDNAVVEQGDRSEEDSLAQALAVSIGQDHTGDVHMDSDLPMTEDEQIARAIEMSMQGGSSATQPSNDIIEDPSFVSSVFDSLPGVNRDDPRIRSLEGLPDKKENEGKKGQDKKEDGDQK
ncbi:hypothetical protein G9A89_011839 [Geosiphon pyriformis]|nr:hypothetical protein G9A89_011839 [Geosiphon pyriformis]